MSKRRFPISIIAEIYEPKCETTSFWKALSLLHLPKFQSPPSVSFSDSTSFHFITQFNPHSLIHNPTASPCSIFRDQQVLTMSSKSLNPNAKPFFHFPSITYTKPLNPNANPFHIQTYLCNPSWQWRPFIPKTRNKLTMDNLPRVRQFSRTMNHNIPVRRKHHVVSGSSVHVWKAKPEEHKDQRNDKLLEKKRSSKGKVIPFPLCSSDQKPFCTTVMIKNIPNQFRWLLLPLYLKRRIYSAFWTCFWLFWPLPLFILRVTANWPMVLSLFVTFTPSVLNMSWPLHAIPVFICTIYMLVFLVVLYDS